MNNELMLMMCKGYKMIVDKIMSEGSHYKFGEVVKFDNLKYKLEDVVYTNSVTIEDYAYITIKLLGSESYYHFGLKYTNIDKRELMLLRAENLLRDKDCNVIKLGGDDDKIKLLYKRNHEGKWIRYESIK